jgi:hypothetical protein
MASFGDSQLPLADPGEASHAARGVSRGERR